MQYCSKEIVIHKHVQFQNIEQKLKIESPISANIFEVLKHTSMHKCIHVQPQSKTLSGSRTGKYCCLVPKPATLFYNQLPVQELNKDV